MGSLSVFTPPVLRPWKQGCHEGKRKQRYCYETLKRVLKMNIRVVLGLY